MTLETSSHEIRIGSIPIDGRLDALRAVELREQIAAEVAAGTVRLIIDLRNAEFVDSAGLAALAKGMKTCRERGGDVRIVRSRHADATRVFALTRFDQVFTMADSPEDLLRSW